MNPKRLGRKRSWANWCIISTFAWGTTNNTKTSIRIARIRVEHLPNVTGRPNCSVLLTSSNYPITNSFFPRQSANHFKFWDVYGIVYFCWLFNDTISTETTEQWTWSSWCNDNWQEKPKYWEKDCLSATLSVTNPTCPDLALNLGSRDAKPPTGRLSYGMAAYW
jgi:hypothetical protein